MKVYIIHVKDAYVREHHMHQQLTRLKADAEWILEGDMQDLNPILLETYFSKEMKTICPATSCAYKHILAYEKLLKTNEPYALVLEDDIYLEANIENILKAIEEEIKLEKYNGLLVSLEDSSLQYVRGRKRKSGQYLYPEKKGRMAGAYLIDRSAASALLKLIQEYKCHLPIDWFHNFAAASDVFQIFWAHPTCAIQGSLNGRLATSIDQKKSGKWRIFSFNIQRIYKKWLWRFR